MFSNSIDLLDYALRELQVAVKKKKKNQKVVIVLKQHYSKDDINKIKQYCDRYEIKEITELLREEFKEYDIKSTVRLGSLTGVVTFSKGPCSLNYPLIWELTLRKKAS